MTFRLTLVASSIAIAIASGWITLMLMDDGGAPGASLSGEGDQNTPAVKTINILEASYGMSCKDFRVSPPNENKVRAGNATASMSAACNKRQGTCKYVVDVVQLGDPAYGCGKDFLVQWRCGEEEKTHEAHLAAEAHGRAIEVSCPRT